MTSVKSINSSAHKEISREAIRTLDASLRGRVYLDGSEEYDLSLIHI